MTTARTTTAQPIAASISIPDAILHSTAFARRKPLLLLKIVRQTSPRSVQLPQTARRRSGKRHRPPRKVRKARVGGLRPHLFVCSEKMARQKGRPDRAGVRRCRKETGRLAGSASAPQRLCTCAGTGTALRRPFFCPLRRLPPPRARRGGATAGGLSAPTAFLHSSPHPSGLGIFSFAAEPCLTPAVPYPARHFSATRLIRCRTRLPLPHPTFPFAPDYTLPNAAFFATPLNCRPLRLLGRTRDFPLRTSALRRP